MNSIKQAIKENWTPTQPPEAVIQASEVFSSDKAAQIADSGITHQQVRGHVGAWSASKKILEYAWQVQDSDVARYAPSSPRKGIRSGGA